MHEKALKKGSIESGKQICVFVTFCASSWLKKSGNTEINLEHLGRLPCK
jgi:hypothetical protein